MGSTGDWLEAHPEEDPDMMMEMLGEFLVSSGWQRRISREPSLSKRRKMMAEAKGDFQMYIDNIGLEP
jgi:hypothetical protein